MARKKLSQRIPLPQVPKLPKAPRNPAGWNRSEVRIATRGHPALSDLSPVEPAGEPPAWWRGTRPEWAVYWALEKLGYRSELDFFFQARMPSAGAGNQANVDFLIPALGLVFEIQGLYWHYQQGREHVFFDIQRFETFLGIGYRVIFIDEDHALSRPMWVVKEALAGRDHSRMTQYLNH